MKSIVQLWETCLIEAGIQHHVRISKDLAYARSRIEAEGISFLTIALPKFEKDFLLLISGSASDRLFSGFKKRSGGLPTFLSGFLRQIFDCRGDVSPSAAPLIKSVRQLLLLVSKIELDCTPSRISNALSGYIRTDIEVEEHSTHPILLDEFEREAADLFGDFLVSVEKALYNEPFPSRYSSGALATRESYNSRFACRTWTQRLQDVLPFWDVLHTSWFDPENKGVEILPRPSETPCRIFTVPKTMKGPRIIAMEPSWNQYVQQGVLALMTNALPLHLNSIMGWMDQEPNRELARLGSVDGSLCTIDLSEASDRVSMELVSRLLARAPYLRKVIFACRSERAMLPDGSIRKLSKFASMGSALCFPIESMVFTTILSLASRLRSIPLSPTTHRVFGDDIIAPKTVAHLLVRLLPAFGLKVNADKSFLSGHFRESCGGDYYRGVDVGVVKIRSQLPTTRRQYSELERSVDFHNRAFSAGYFGLSNKVADLLSESGIYVPRVPAHSTAIGFYTYDTVLISNKNRYQVPTVRSMIFRRTKPVDELDGYGACVKTLSPHGELESDHLHRDGRSRYAGVHIGWSRI